MTRTDITAGSAGAITAVWNFLVSGQLNMLLAAVVGVLTILVLIQRFRINRRELNKQDIPEVKSE